MRLEIHVQPGAKAESVGGAHGGALVVRVRRPAEKGRATAAAQHALARALGVHDRDVHLVAGATSRRKIVEIDVDAREHESIARRIDQLRRSGDGARLDPGSEHADPVGPR